MILYLRQLSPLVFCDVPMNIICWVVLSMWMIRIAGWIISELRTSHQMWFIDSTLVSHHLQFFRKFAQRHLESHLLLAVRGQVFILRYKADKSPHNKDRIYDLINRSPFVTCWFHRGINSHVTTEHYLLWQPLISPLLFGFMIFHHILLFMLHLLCA